MAHPKCTCRLGRRDQACPLHGSKRQLPSLPPTRQDQCKHKRLHFENGGMHVVCEDCKEAWTAVGHCPMRTIFNFAALSHGLSDIDKRYDPSAGPISASKPSTKP